MMELVLKPIMDILWGCAHYNKSWTLSLWSFVIMLCESRVQLHVFSGVTLELIIISVYT